MTEPLGLLGLPKANWSWVRGLTKIQPLWQKLNQGTSLPCQGPPSCSSRKANAWMKDPGDLISGCLFTVGSIRNIKTHHISTHTLALQLSVVVCSQQRSLQVHKYASTMRKILLHCVKQNQEREQDKPPKKDILFRCTMLYTKNELVN